MRSEILLAIIAALAAGAAFAGFGDIVCSWKAPPTEHGDGNCPGVAWDGTHIWCVVTDTVTYSRYFYRCRPANGSVISSFPSNNLTEGHGVAGMCYRKIGGTHYLDVNVRDSSAMKCFRYRYDNKGSFVGRYQLGVSAFSIYHDGSNYWVSGKRDPTCPVYKLNASGSPISSFVLSERGYPNGMCKQASFFWFSVETYVGYPFYGGFKTKADGSVVASFFNPYFRRPMSDCTFDGKYLWIVTRNNRVCRCDVSNAPAVLPASVGRIKALYR